MIEIRLDSCGAVLPRPGKASLTHHAGFGFGHPWGSHFKSEGTYFQFSDFSFLRDNAGGCGSKDKGGEEGADHNERRKEDLAEAP